MKPCYGIKDLQTRFFHPFHLVFLFLFAFGLILSLFPQNVQAIDITLAWDKNTEEDLAGYRIFYREGEGSSYDYSEPDWEEADPNCTTCTIPGLDDSKIYYFVARAFDTSENESSNSNEVCYLPEGNEAPIANAGDDQTVNEADTVTLDGSGSTDPEGNIEDYLWTQLAGTPVVLDDPYEFQTTFTAPLVGVSGETLTFQLEITDDEGLKDTDTITIIVTNINQAPSANAGPDQSVYESDTVTLDGSNSTDPDGFISAYLWSQIGGTNVILSDTTESQPFFTAPYVGAAGESLLFRLTVTDDGGLQSIDTCIVNVSTPEANLRPLKPVVTSPGNGQTG